MKTTPNLRWLAAALCLMLLMGMVPVANAYDGPLRVANPNPKDRLHLRASPDPKAESLGKYYNGVEVVVWGYEGDWYRVRIGLASGYMLREYLTMDQVASAMPSMTVSNPKSTDRLHLRAEPSADADSLGRYSNGTKVLIWGICGDWYHVVAEDGQEGYMLAKYLKDGIGGGTPSLPSAGTGKYAIVNNPNASSNLVLRASPSTAAASLGRYGNAVTVELLSAASNGWYKVKVDGQTGYMQAKYLQVDGTFPDYIQITEASTASLTSSAKFYLRAEPNESAKLVASYGNGELMQVLDRAGMWLKVRMNKDQREGYMLNWNLSIGGPTTMVISTNVGTVTGPNYHDRLNLRSGKSADAAILTKLFCGTQVLLLEEQGDWLYVQVGKYTGYVQRQFVVLGNG